MVPRRTQIRSAGGTAAALVRTSDRSGIGDATRCALGRSGVHRKGGGQCSRSQLHSEASTSTGSGCSGRRCQSLLAAAPRNDCPPCTRRQPSATPQGADRVVLPRTLGRVSVQSNDERSPNQVCRQPLSPQVRRWTAQHRWGRTRSGSGIGDWGTRGSSIPVLRGAPRHVRTRPIRQPPALPPPSSARAAPASAASRGRLPSRDPPATAPPSVAKEPAPPGPRCRAPSRRR